MGEVELPPLARRDATRSADVGVSQFQDIVSVLDSSSKTEDYVSALPLEECHFDRINILPEPNADIPDYSVYTENQKIKTLEEFRVAFDNMRKQGATDVPVVTEDSDLRHLHVRLNIHKRNRSIKRQVGLYKTRMVVMWGLIELGAWFINFDMNGYLDGEIKNLPAYDETFMSMAYDRYKNTNVADLDEDDTSSFWKTIWKSLKNFFKMVIIGIIATVARWFGVPALAITCIRKIGSYLIDICIGDEVEEGDGANSSAMDIMQTVTSQGLSGLIPLATRLFSNNAEPQVSEVQ